jgi:hypothetical protein
VGILAVGGALSEPKRHHYLPIFYLKRWTDQDGRLCEYSRPHSIVKSKRKYPSATGYVDGLYTIPGVSPERVEIVEKQFMRAIDNEGARAIEAILNSDFRERRTEFVPLSDRQRFWFATFIWSLFVRLPASVRQLDELGTISNLDVEKLEPLRQSYPYLRGPSDPESFDEFKALQHSLPEVPGAQLIPTTVRNYPVIVDLASMASTVAQFEITKYSILTSDRPALVTENFSHPESFLTFSLSPKHVYLAARDSRRIRKIKTFGPDAIAKAVNDQIVSHAYKYVYGTDDSQLRFVENRLQRHQRTERNSR